MSDDQNDKSQGDDGDDEDRQAPTPFDIVTEAQAYQDNPKFNEYGLLIMGALALYFTWSAIKEKRAERDKSSD